MRRLNHARALLRYVQVATSDAGGHSAVVESREGSRADLPQLVADVLDGLVRFLCAGESATARVELDAVGGRVEGWRVVPCEAPAAGEA